MSIVLRIVLVLFSLLTLTFMLKRIRKSKLQIEYSIFWIIFAFLLMILSIFPQIAIFFAELCGIASPVNFVFLFVIFVLLLHEFHLTIHISINENRIINLTQEIAIRDSIKQKEEQEKIASKADS